MIIVPENQREGESIQEEKINHMRIRKRRYNILKTTTLTKVTIGQQKYNLLSDWMYYKRMEDNDLDTCDEMGEEKDLVPKMTNKHEHKTNVTPIRRNNTPIEYLLLFFFNGYYCCCFF